MISIFEAAAAYHRKAMAELYELNKAKAYYLSLLLTGDEEEAIAAVNVTFQTVWDSILAHNIETYEEFTHLVIRKATDYLKRKISKKDGKAFRTPPQRNFLVIPTGALPEEDADVNAAVLRYLPDLQRFILVLHSVGEYVPEQIAGTFKFDMKTVGMALEAEETNVKRILKYIGVSECDYDAFIEELTEGERTLAVPEEVDSCAYTVIDSLAGPLERKRRGTVLKICVGILASLIVIGGTVLVAVNSGKYAATAEDTDATEGTTVSDTADSTVITEPVIELDDSAVYYADIAIENQGTITVKLDQAAAPVTVSNFVNLAQNGFYDGLTFHRIIENFMMQGGCPSGDGYGSNTDEDGNEINIVGEFANNGYENNLSHTRGAISMVRSSEYNSGSSQFFIVHEDSSDSLDGDYAVFGYVSEGMEIVDTICEAAEPTDENGSIAADEQPVITSITIRTETE